MGLEGLMSGCFCPCYVELSAESTYSKLLEKGWNTASDLQVTNRKVFIQDNLLCFCEISDIALIVDAPCVVASSRFLVRPSGNKNKGDFLLVRKRYGEGLDISLDDGLSPAC